MGNMTMTRLTRTIGIAAGIVALAVGVASAPAIARDAAYAAARAAQQVGEKMDGYLGAVSGSTSSLRAMVDDINIKRKAVYAQKAKAQHVRLKNMHLPLAAF